MQDFQGKRVVVTGGSRGIGRAVASVMAGAGARVAIVARDPERAQAAAAEIDGDVKAIAADVADENAVTEVFSAVVEDWGGLDILVNNAGVTRDNLLMRMSTADWDDVLAINLRGTFLCTRAALRPMLRQRWGRIINVSSVIGMRGNAGQGNYAASKAGIIGFTKSLARELASRSITVNAVAPGLIDTDMTRALAEDSRKEILGQIPLGRLGTAEDVAGTVQFLASDAASYITGEVIKVDGGMSM